MRFDRNPQRSLTTCAATSASSSSDCKVVSTLASGGPKCLPPATIVTSGRWLNQVAKIDYCTAMVVALVVKIVGELEIVVRTEVEPLPVTLAVLQIPRALIPAAPVTVAFTVAYRSCVQAANT